MKAQITFLTNGNATMSKLNSQLKQINRSESVKAASTGSATGSSEPVSKKKYRASDLRRLKNSDPQAYANRNDEFVKAYLEGRVVHN